jgi:hypothetical protein
MVSVAVPDPNAKRPVESGTVGGDISVPAGTAPGVIPAGIILNNKNFSLKLTSDAPAIPNLDISFISTGEPVPATVQGVCRLLERKTNEALAAAGQQASVRCVPSSTGLGVRVLALFKGGLDAKITFS